MSNRATVNRLGPLYAGFRRVKQYSNNQKSNNTAMKSLNQSIKGNEAAYAYGFKSYDRALTVMYGDISADLLTESLCRIGSYWGQDKKTGGPVKRYAIFEVRY